MTRKQPDPPTFESEQLLTADQVQQLLNLSRSFIYALVKRGELPTVRIHRAVRFRLQDVQEYILRRARKNNDEPARKTR